MWGAKLLEKMDFLNIMSSSSSWKDRVIIILHEINVNAKTTDIYLF